MNYNYLYEVTPPRLIDIIISLVPLALYYFAIQIYTIWIEKDAEKFLSTLKTKRVEVIDNSKTNEEFETLLVFAQNEVENLIANLPDDIQIKAKETPCIFEPTIMYGDDKFVLGTYSAYVNRIIIYLGSITESIKFTKLELGYVIRKTYLHELAHRFGLNEKEVYDRGLAFVKQF